MQNCIKTAKMNHSWITELSDNLYDLEMTQAGHREFCRILGIKNEEDLQRMMLFGMPLLEVRAKQLEGAITWREEIRSMQRCLPVRYRVTRNRAGAAPFTFQTDARRGFSGDGR